MPNDVEHKVAMNQLARQRQKAGLPIWQYSLDLSFVDLNPDDDWEGYRDQVTYAIKNSDWYAAKGQEDSTLWWIVDEFKDSEDREHGSYVFDALYDEADHDRCWIRSH